MSMKTLGTVVASKAPSVRPLENSHTYRVVMLGNAGVGKSALVVRYLTHRFIYEYDPTLECTYQHSTVIDEDTSSIEILDTAGQGLCNTIHSEGQLRWGDAFLLVYSITDRESFKQIPRIKSQLDDLKKSSNVSCVLVANKCDLECTRTVSTEEGEKMALNLACAFFETSACDPEEDIGDIFHELCREVRRKRTNEGKLRRRSSGLQVRHVFSKVFTKIQNWDVNDQV